MASFTVQAHVFFIFSCCILSHAGPGTRLSSSLDRYKNQEGFQRSHTMLTNRRRRAVIRGQSYRWPTMTDVRGQGNLVVIPYIIDKSIGNSARQALFDAFKEYKKYTCVRFVQRTSQLDYLKIFYGQGCYSPIGRQGGVQLLSIGKNCDVRGHVIHELMHALGFVHEQNRPDRDKFVKILWDNIKSQMIEQFKRHRNHEVTSLGESYDYASIMHYTDKEFSRNGLKTMKSKVDSSQKIGQLHGFSATDIKQINKLYSCPKIANGVEIHNYKVTVHTGDALLAGTNARVFITLYGESFGRLVNSEEAEVATGGKKDDFERGSVKTFLVVSPYLGTLRKLSVRHDGRGLFSGWLLNKIVVTDPKNRRSYTFVCSCWLEQSNPATILTPS